MSAGVCLQIQINEIYINENKYNFLTRQRRNHLHKCQHCDRAPFIPHHLCFCLSLSCSFFLLLLYLPFFFFITLYSLYTIYSNNTHHFINFIIFLYNHAMASQAYTASFHLFFFINELFLPLFSSFPSTSNFKSPRPLFISFSYLYLPQILLSLSNHFSSFTLIPTSPTVRPTNNNNNKDNFQYRHRVALVHLSTRGPTFLSILIRS